MVHIHVVGADTSVSSYVDGDHICVCAFVSSTYLYIVPNVMFLILVVAVAANIILMSCSCDCVFCEDQVTLINRCM